MMRKAARMIRQAIAAANAGKGCAPGSRVLVLGPDSSSRAVKMLVAADAAERRRRASEGKPLERAPLELKYAALGQLIKAGGSQVKDAESVGSTSLPGRGPHARADA
jgi:hypothetical protein